MEKVYTNKKEEIKEKFKHFFELNNIPFKEKENKIEVKGKAFDIQISGIPSISVRLGIGVYLDIIEFKDYYRVMYIDTNYNRNNAEMDIYKGETPFENPIITYFDEKLIIYF